MSFPKMDQVFPRKSEVISDLEIAKIVASALRQDFGDTPSSVKHIGRLTGANLRSIKNWYEAGNAPSAGHLLLLGRTSQTLLKFILEQVGGGDLRDAFFLLGGKITTAANDEYEAPRDPIYSDRLVTITVILDPEDLGDLNQRQLWFLGQLQQKHKPRAEDIAKTWQVTERTAERDLATLSKKNLIYFTGARKTGWYVYIDKELVSKKKNPL